MKERLQEANLMTESMLVKLRLDGGAEYAERCSASVCKNASRVNQMRPSAKEVLTLDARIRALHKRLTLPFVDDEWDLLPIGVYPYYTEFMDKLFEQRVMLRTDILKERMPEPPYVSGCECWSSSEELIRNLTGEYLRNPLEKVYKKSDVFGSPEDKEALLDRRHELRSKFFTSVSTLPSVDPINFIPKDTYDIWVELAEIEKTIWGMEGREITAYPFKPIVLFLNALPEKTMQTATSSSLFNRIGLIPQVVIALLRANAVSKKDTKGQRWMTQST